MADYIGIVYKRNKESFGLLRQLARKKGFENWDQYYEADRLEILTNREFKVKVKKYELPGKEFQCFVIGNVFISQDVALEIIKLNGLKLNSGDESLLPFLLFGNTKKALKQLTGDYNLIIHDRSNSSVSIISSRFGMIPLYYYENENQLVFSSKIHLLTRSGLVHAEIDHISWLEHFIFNHFPGENTGIKNIKLYPPASIVEIRENTQLYINRYWQTDELLNIEKQYNKSHGLELINNAIKYTLKKYIERVDHPAVTLTGGWDGRLVLSYLSGLTNDFFIYSFGARYSSDITIPSEISHKLGFRYVPMVLDDDYLSDHFLTYGKKTIIESDGMRPFSRAHYLYAINQVSKETQFLISGNCGSNILKTSKRASYMLNQQLLDLIEKGHLNDKMIAGINRLVNEYPNSNINTNQRDELIERLGKYEITNRRDLTSNQRFYLFILDEVERKYFGIEGKTYNQSLENFSFFIDYDFLKALSQTIFFGTHLPFYHNNLKYRYLTTWLYAKLIKQNNPALSGYISDKGFSLDEALNPLGKLKALFKKIRNQNKRKINQPDSFNTRPTEALFQNFLIEQNLIENEDLLKINGLSREKRVDYLSWIYWKKIGL
jgi:hypothetical protein